jgi:hypothetical protein
MSKGTRNLIGENIFFHFMTLMCFQNTITFFVSFPFPHSQSEDKIEMLNEDLVYLMNVLECLNLWKVPIHWDRKKEQLYFNPKLKQGFFLSNFIMIFCLFSVFFLLGKQILLPDMSNPIPVLILPFNMLILVMGIVTVFMEKVLYSCGPELVYFFRNIEPMKMMLQSTGEWCNCKKTDL